MTPQARSISMRTLGLATLGLLVVGFAIWSLRRNHAQPVVVTTEESAESPELPELAAAIQPLPEPVVLAARVAPTPPKPEVADDGIPIMGPGSSDSTANGPRHPHPFTPQHERIFKENSMLGSLNGAMDAGDPDALRQLNAEYRVEFPDDPQQLQTGYDLIAECLEQRTEETRAKAQRYFDEQRGSTLRRFVKRHCLE